MSEQTGIERLNAVPEGCTPADARVLRDGNFQLAAENQALRQALRFYANGDHMIFDKPELWEDVSGEPPNVLQRENDGFCEMVEDGTLARYALLGKEIDWDGEEPKVIEGEPEDLAVKQAENAEVADAARVIAWARDANRKPANVAFTAGAERQAAYWIEWAEAAGSDCTCG